MGSLSALFLPEILSHWQWYNCTIVDVAGQNYASADKRAAKGGSCSKNEVRTAARE